MKIENFIGAMIAAFIGFITGFLALLTQDGVSGIADISEVAWYVLAGGAVLAFSKDAQALWARRKISNLVGSNINRITCHPAAILLSGLLALSLLTGCGIQRPQVDSVSDAVIVTAADIESLATTVKELCRNTVPGGPCAPGAAISTSTKESLKVTLQTAHDMLDGANRMLAAGDSEGAWGRLNQVELALAIMRDELQRRSTP